MPGIVGIVSLGDKRECSSLVERMVGAMAHESFYSSFTDSDSESGVYFGAVVNGSDTSLAKRDGVLVMIKGNAYVDVPLKSPGRGRDLAGQLVEWYLQKGEDEMITTRLVGTFCGFLVDQRSGKTILFNDRYGFERLYVSEKGKDLIFASEAKAVLAVNPDAGRFDQEGLTQYLTLGSTVEGRSLYHNVEVMQGGSVWTWRGGELQKKKYFEPAEWEQQGELSEDEFQARFEESLSQIVPRHTQGDSPIGISLTGGLDTRMVMAVLPDLSCNPICYTYTGTGREIRDAKIARKVATALGFQHESIRIENDFFDQFGALLDKTVALTDGYFGACGAHEVYLSSKARQFSPTRLTGVFGGEVMRGVNTFKPLGLDPAILNPDLAAGVEEVEDDFRAKKFHPITFAAFREIPWNVHGTIAACKSQVEFRTPYLDDNLVKLFYRMPRSCNTGESATRLVSKLRPELFGVATDMGLLGNMGTLRRLGSRGWAKVTFKLDYYSDYGMPNWLSHCDPLIERAGFQTGILGQHMYLRYRSWFRKSLSGVLRERLSDSSVTDSPIWNQKVVSQIAEEHISGKRNRTAEINAVLTLATVEKLLLKPSEKSSSVAEKVA